jgi:hypothetical protein
MPNVLEACSSLAWVLGREITSNIAIEGGDDEIDRIRGVCVVLVALGVG